MKRNIIEFTRASDTPDADFSHVRGEAVLDKLLRRYPGDAESLARAHQLLQDEPNYAPAMNRVAHSLHEGRIQAFISYRVGIDAEAARTVADVFRALSGNQVSVTFADDFTARISGQDYKSEIEAATKASHWFVILVSDSREPSGWCMYETGLFRASVTSRRMERLICLHHPRAALPAAIDGFQSVPCDVAHLQRFLDGLFRKSDPLPGWDALNPNLDDGAILEAATRIARALRPPRKPVAFNFGLTLEVHQPARLAAGTDLDDCSITTDRLTANLFGKVDPPDTWGQLVANLQPSEGGDSDWLTELVAVLRKASAGNIFRPLTGTFESVQGGRVLRPVVHAMEHDGVSDDFRFQLFFLEEFASAPSQGLGAPTRALLALVRMHNRVRWEVLERFADSRWPTEQCDACDKAFSRIERESRAQGGIDLPALRELYAPDQAGQVAVLTAQWQALCNGATGSLSQALRYGKVELIRDGMTRCRELNRRVLELSFPVLEALTTGKH